MQEVAQVEQVSLNYDEEGHGQKHQDEHVHWEFRKNVNFKKIRLEKNEIVR